MPPPASFLLVSSLPYSRVVTQAEFNAGTYGTAANEVWFKYVPAVDSVVAFMPPPPGETNTPNVLFFEKSALKDQLDQPLSKTLTLSTPPLPSSEDLGEAATIDKLTLKNIFSYELTALPTGGAAIVLDPAT